LANILLHGANAALIWLILRRLNARGCWLAAALFALHPVQVESVAWIVELKNVLSWFLALLATLVFLHNEAAPRRPLLALSVALFALALLSKTAVVMLPAGLLILLWWKNPRLDRRDFFQLAPFAAVALIAVAADMFVVAKTGKSVAGIAFADRLVVAGKATWFYASKLIAPVNLCAIYPRWETASPGLVRFLYPLSAIGVVIALFLARRRIGKTPAAGALFYLAMLLPTLGLVEFSYMRQSFVADRFQYHASIGLLAPFAAFLASTASRLRLNEAAKRVAVAGILLLSGAGTLQRATVYKNMQSLCTDTISRNPAAWTARYLLARDLARAGKYAPALKHYSATFWGTIDEWGASYDAFSQQVAKGMAQRPGDASVRYNHGLLLALDGALEDARGEFSEAIRLKPNLVEARIARAAILDRMGHCEDAIRDVMAAAGKAP
jgi:tetratricopeptide (TPR) repeat protein